jgi:hypothetical protein
MASRRLGLSLVTWAVVLIAISALALADSATARTAPILNTLSAALRSIEAGSYGDVSGVMKIRLRPLVGLTKAEIVAVLGNSGECTSGGSDWCRRKGDFIYSFYTICDDCLGGGPELMLRFDDSGKCIRARWVLSQ